MKNYFIQISALSFLIFSACENNTNNETNSKNDEIVDEQIAASSDQFAVDQWDEFRFAIVNNDPDFDLLKHYNPEQVPHEVAQQLIDDEYTKMTLGITSYDDLEDEIFDGISAKAFYVLVAADDITIGTIYYFRETSYGFQLLGTMPY
jgi:hypothetical protein